MVARCSWDARWRLIRALGATCGDQGGGRQAGLREAFLARWSVLGGVAPFPLRAARAETALRGKTIKDGMADACKIAIEGVQPLSGNGYKVKAMQGIIEKALTSLA